MTVIIIATMPRPADPGAVADKLREAAKASGCQLPVVEMRWPDEHGRFEFVVRCADDTGKAGP